MPVSIPVAPDQKLERYGELAVRVALNLQPGQRLLIIGPLMNGGVSLEAAPLVRHIAASAYRAGARTGRGDLGRRVAAARAVRPRTARLVRSVLRLVAQGARRACAGRSRGPVDLRQRSRSPAARVDRTGRRAPAGDVSEHDPVSRAHLPQPHQLVGDRGGRRGVGGEGVSERRPRINGSSCCAAASRACAVSIGPIRCPPGSSTSTRWRRAATF